MEEVKRLFKLAVTLADVLGEQIDTITVEALKDIDPDGDTEVVGYEAQIELANGRLYSISDAYGIEVLI